MHLLKRQTVSAPVAWHGSLVMDGQHASGLSYRRNPSYDANSFRRAYQSGRPSRRQNFVKGHDEQ